MSHLKRQFAPKNWPIPRKGTTFVIKPNFGLSKGIPLLIVLRDMLKIVQDRKEAKKAIYLEKIFVNGKKARDEKDGILLFDVITIIPSKKHYCLSVSLNGKFELKEITEKESNNKTLLEKVSLLERKIASKDNLIVSPRFISKTLYLQIGGINEDLDPIDEGDMKAKLDELGIKYVDIESEISINNTKTSLSERFNKK